MENKENNPTVSLITTVYNGELYLKKYFNMIQNQSFRDFELIIVDDGSNDETGNIIENHVKTIAINYIACEHVGVSQARNLGLSEAKGNYIMFADVDDEFDDDFIESYVNEISGREHVDILLYPINKTFNGKTEKVSFSEGRINRNDFLKQLYGGDLNGWLVQGIIKKTSIVDVEFIKDINYAEDFLFLKSAVSRRNLQIYLSGSKKPKYTYVVRADSVTNVGSKETFEKVRALVEYLMDESADEYVNMRRTFAKRQLLFLFRQTIEKNNFVLKEEIQEYILEMGKNIDLNFLERVRVTYSIFSLKKVIKRKIGVGNDS